MKCLKYLLLVAASSLSMSALAQNSKIETDLLRSFKKLEYWDHLQRKGKDGATDSLEAANDAFDAKLKNYAVKDPGTIAEPFNSLKKVHLDIFTSADGMFRIYSWETWMGGTMRDFSNLMQYKVGGATKANLLISDQNNYIPFYSNLYTFKAGSKTYYLGIYNTIYSTKDAGTGIRVFSIENGKLNSDTRVIKTQLGLKSKIYYDYDFFSIMDMAMELRPTITFDVNTQTIKIPVVDGSGKFTHKLIQYKFNGQYFERVKA